MESRVKVSSAISCSEILLLILRARGGEKRGRSPCHRHVRRTGSPALPPSWAELPSAFPGVFYYRSLHAVSGAGCGRRSPGAVTCACCRVGSRPLALLLPGPPRSLALPLLSLCKTRKDVSAPRLLLRFGVWLCMGEERMAWGFFFFHRSLAQQVQHPGGWRLCLSIGAVPALPGDCARYRRIEVAGKQRLLAGSGRGPWQGRPRGSLSRWTGSRAS